MELSARMRFEYSHNDFFLKHNFQNGCAYFRLKKRSNSQKMFSKKSFALTTKKIRRQGKSSKEVKLTSMLMTDVGDKIYRRHKFSSK